MDVGGLRISPVVCPPSSQMVVWLKKGELPRAVTRYGEEQPQLGPRSPLLLWEGSCRMLLSLSSVPGTPTITRRTITEPSCHRW